MTIIFNLKMKKDTKDLSLFRLRSNGAVIRDGFLLYLDNFRKILRSTWTSALVYAIVTSLLTTLFIEFYPSILMTRIMQATHPEGMVAGDDDVQLMVIVGIICGSLIYVLASALLASSAFTLLVGHHRDGAFPASVHWYGSLDRKTTARTFVSWLSMALFPSLFLLLVGAIVIMISGQLSSQVGFYTYTGGIAVAVIVVLLIMPLFLMRMISYIENSDVKKAWKGRFALRYWGSSLMVAIIVSIVVSVFHLATQLPSSILLSANIAAQQGVLLGDNVSMPDYALPMNLIVFTLAAFIQAYILMAALFPFHYLLGSVETLERERDEMSQKLTNP